MAAGVLWILDASINITMEPFRAFVGDMLPKEQRKSGFAMQSLLIGLGAVLSSALPYMLTNWFGVTNTGGEGRDSPHRADSRSTSARRCFFVAVALHDPDNEGVPAGRPGGLPEDEGRVRRHRTTRSRRSSTASARCPRRCGNWRWCSSSPGSPCSACGSTSCRRWRRECSAARPARRSTSAATSGAASASPSTTARRSCSRSCCWRWCSRFSARSIHRLCLRRGWRSA